MKTNQELIILPIIYTKLNKVLQICTLGDVANDERNETLIFVLM